MHAGVVHRWLRARPAAEAYADADTTAGAAAGPAGGAAPGTTAGPAGGAAPGTTAGPAGGGAAGAAADRAARGTSGRPLRAALTRLAPVERALVVLCTYDALDPTVAAEIVGTSPTRAREQVRLALIRTADALGLSAEQVPFVVREALQADAAGARVPDGLIEAAGVRAGQHAAARRRRRWVALGFAVLTLVGAGAATALVRRPPPTSVPVGAGLLDWPTRGDLSRDASFREAALRKWREVGPVHEPHPLFLGRIGEGRVAVLEGIAADEPRVALVAEHSNPGGVALELDAVSALTDPHLPVLLVPYDGNLNIPGLGVGPPAALVQVLVAPWVTRVQQVSVQGGYRAQDVRVRSGLSDAWLALPTGRGLGTVRAYAGEHPVLDATVPFRGLVPVANPGEEPFLQ